MGVVLSCGPAGRQAGVGYGQRRGRHTPERSWQPSAGTALLVRLHPHMWGSRPLNSHLSAVRGTKTPTSYQRICTKDSICASDVT